MAANRVDQGQAAQRLHMVNGQLRTSDVNDLAVLAAFLEVPRELFVAPEVRKLAYADRDQFAVTPPGRKLLAPRTLALLLQAAAILPGERALDVGGGSGYSAVLLQHMGAAVVVVESDPRTVRFVREALARHAGAEVVEGKLAEGLPAKAPFDVILINGAFETTPTALIGQLAVGGRLVGIDARSGSPRGVIIDKSAAGYSERSLFDATAEVLDAFRRAPSFVF